MPIDIARVQAICFDVDGTLSDTDDLWVSQAARRLAFIQRLAPRLEARSLARRLVMAAESPANAAYWLADTLNLDAPIGRLYQRLARRSTTIPRTFWLIPQVDGMLTQLAQHYPMSVVSARDQATTLAFLETFALRSLFRAVATSQTCLHTKPFPDPILWVAQQMGVEPQHCLMVGDTTVDIRAGKAAGAQTVGVLCGFGIERELRRAGADCILSSTAELPALLAG